MDDLYQNFDQNLYKKGNAVYSGDGTPLSTTSDIAPASIGDGFSTGSTEIVQNTLQSANFLKNTRGWQLTPTSAEINTGTLVIGGTIINVSDITLLQTEIDLLQTLGGGTIALAPNTYTATSSFTIPSGVTINGNGATIDFGGGAYQFLIQGTNAYSTGTASINFGSTTVTGVGTTWTAGMIGQSILLGDFWYIISARASNTSITIGLAFKGTTLSGDTYVIATTVDGTAILNLTVQNSSISLIKGIYLNVITIDSVNAISGDMGFEFRDTFSPFLLNFGGDTCTTNTVLLNNCPYSTISTYTILNGTGMSLTRVSNCGISVGSWQRITGVALSYTNCYNIGLSNYSIIECTSHGIEFVSGNNDIDTEGGYINTCGGDGIKLTATSDRINISSNSLLNNTGWGVNIANSNCDNNNVELNIFSNNTAGNLTDSGTSTKIRGNQGVSDNIVEGDLSLADITTNNVSSSKHGFAPKGNGSTTTFLNGNGAYSTPASGGFPVQDVPMSAGTSVPDNGGGTGNVITSNSTGTVIYYANASTTSTITIYRIAKDANTSNYYATHSVTLANAFTPARYYGMAVVGSSLYISTQIAGPTNSVTRYVAADLTSPTTFTFSGTSTKGSCWSDGTDLFIWEAADNFYRYTISGTVLTNAETRAFTGAGTVTSSISDGTSVWTSDISSAGGTNAIKKYAVAGGAASSTTTVSPNTAAFLGGTCVQLFVASSSTLGIGWAFNFTSATAVNGIGVHLMGITLP